MSNDIYTQAMESFEERYSDFLVMFDGKAFYAKVRDEIALSGVTKPITVNSIVLDTEQAAVRLLDRGALNSIQKFGATEEAEVQITELRERVSGQARVVATSDRPSKWVNLTYVEWQRLPSSEDRNRRNADPEYRAKVESLIGEHDAKTVVDITDTRRVYLRRKSDQKVFKEWKNQIDYWTSDFSFRATMTYDHARYEIDKFSRMGYEVEAHEVGNHRLVDLFSKPTEVPTVGNLASPWRLEPSKL